MLIPSYVFNIVFRQKNRTPLSLIFNIICNLSIIAYLQNMRWYHINLL